MSTPVIYRAPLDGSWPITKHFGEDGHSGTDFGCGIHNAVRATAGGTVVAVGFGIIMDYNYGHWVCIKLDDSTLLHPKYSFDAHMEFTSVRVGQKVARGQKIGSSGATGDCTGPHLHHAMMTRKLIKATCFDSEPYIARRTEKAIAARTTAVTASYVRLIGRTPDPARLHHWVNLWTQGRADQASVEKYLRSTAAYRKYQKKH